MVKFTHNNEIFYVAFISSMGKGNADFNIIGKNLDKRIREGRKNEYPKQGIERKALAAWEKEDTRKFRQWCRDRNENYLSRYSNA